MPWALREYGRAAGAGQGGSGWAELSWESPQRHRRVPAAALAADRGGPKLVVVLKVHLRARPPRVRPGLVRFSGTHSRPCPP